MLGDIFYFTGLFLFFLTASKTLNFFKFMDIYEWLIKFKKVTEKNPIKTDFRSEDEYKLFLSYTFITLSETIWFICGLLSQSWIIFGLVLIISMLSRVLFNLLPFTLQKYLGFLISLFKTAVILILVINHFHLHKDLVSYIW